MWVSIISLVVVIAAVGLYFVKQNYDENNAKLIEDAGIEGYKQGAIEVMTYISEQVTQCKQVPLNVSGVITTLVAMECLQ